jgi:hypothetical protein
MADLEEHAIKRDKAFLVRLVLALVAGAIAGVFIFAKLTDESVGSCAADAFGDIADPPPSSP